MEHWFSRFFPSALGGFVFCPMIQAHIGFTSSEWDARRTFKFVVENSTPEWSLIGNKYGKWALGTVHQGSQAPIMQTLGGYSSSGIPQMKVISGFEIEMQRIHIHNHQGMTAKMYRPSSEDQGNANNARLVNPYIKF